MTTTDYYPYWIEQTAQGTFRAHFPDLPALQTQASSITSLMEQLHEAVVIHLEELLKQGGLPPAAHTPRLGEEILWLSPIIVAKLLLIATLRSQNLSLADFTRLMNCRPQEAQRYVKLSQYTRIETLFEALQAVGVHLKLAIEPASSNVSTTAPQAS